MSEHTPSLHLFQLHFIFLQTNTKLTRGCGGEGEPSIRVIMSLKHLKAFGRPDTRRSEGPGEQRGITLQFLERGESQMSVLEGL